MIRSHLARRAEILLAFLLALISADRARADDAATLRLPFVLGSNMVLQREFQDPIWGWDTPGASITVSFAGQTKTATADEKGAWRVNLDPLSASSAARTMTISDSSQTISLTNILIGEVWLCSGQSNMEKPVGKQRGQIPTDNAAQEIAAADHPLIRLLIVPEVRTNSAASKIPWQVCTPTSLDSSHFSAIGYFFARKLQQDLNVPVGVIDSSWGGTRIEAWIDPGGYASQPTLKALDRQIQARQPTTRPSSLWRYSGLFHDMIEPMIPFSVRGVLWYQGESNVMTHDRSAYLDKMEALVHGWRAAWGRDDLPFYWVELAPYTYTTRKGEDSGPDELPQVWEAQEKAVSALPHTGMVATTDLVSDPTNIHPTRKREVAERLELLALKNDYGQPNLIVSGPVFKSADFVGSHAIIHFDDIGSGLQSSDGKPLTFFTVAGAGGKWMPADAMIQGETVIVTSPGVDAPKAVRFAWDEVAMPNLENKEGLPALPFRTDGP